MAYQTYYKCSEQSIRVWVQQMHKIPSYYLDHYTNKNTDGLPLEFSTYY